MPSWDPDSSNSSSGPSWSKGGGSSSGGVEGKRRERKKLIDKLGGAAKDIGKTGLNPVMRALEIADLGRAAVVSGAKEIDDAVPFLAKLDQKALGTHKDKFDEASIGDLVKGIKAHQGYGDFVDSGNKWVDRGIGFTGDVALDPLSYVTFGATELGSKALRVGAKDAARKLAEQGERELAETVLRRGVGGLSAAEAEKAGLRHGATIGIGERRVRIPGSGPAAQAVGKVTGPVREAALTSKAGRTIATKLSAAAEAVPRGDLVDRLGVEDALKRAKAEAAGIGQRHRRTLAELIRRHKDVDTDELRRALEGQAPTSAASSDVRRLLDSVADDVERVTGRTVPRLEDYLPHQATEEFREALAEGGRRGRRAGGHVDATLRREKRIGTKWFGRELETGSIDEMEAIAKDALGDDYIKVFKDNPWEIAHAYIGSMEKEARKQGLVKGLVERGVGGARTTELSEKNGVSWSAPNNVFVAERAPQAATADLIRSATPEAKEITSTAGKAARRATKAEKLAARAAELEEALAALRTPEVAVAAAPDVAAAEAKLAAAEAKLAAARTAAEIKDAGAKKAAAEEQLRLLGRGETFEGPRTPNPTVEEGAASYIEKYGKKLGLDPKPVDPNVRVDDAFATRIAEAYDALPETATDPKTKGAYRALVDEVEAQYDHLTKKLGIKVEFVDDDPYADAAEMMADVVNNKRLKVYRTADDQAHPYMTREQNDKFRAVHDFFGHAQAGNRFDRHGEEVAYRLHSQMFSEKARPAMATETRGQNSYLNYHPSNVERRAQGLRAEFPPQKAALLPDEFVQAAPTARGGRPLAAEEIARAKAIIKDLQENEGLLARVRQFQTNATAKGDDRAAVAASRRLDELKVERVALVDELEGFIRILSGEGTAPSTAPDVTDVAGAVERARKVQELAAKITAPRKPTRAELKAQQLVDELRSQVDHASAAVDGGGPEAAANAARLAEITATETKLSAARAAEVEARTEAQRLFAEAEKMRAARQGNLAAIATLEAMVKHTEAEAAQHSLRALAKREAAAGVKLTHVTSDAHRMYEEGLRQFATDKWAEPWVAEAVLATENLLTPPSAGKFMRLFDTVTSRWKAYSLLSPGFHERNFMGGMFNNSLAGMDPRHYFTYATASRQLRKGGLAAIKDADVRAAFEAMDRLGVLEGHNVRDLSDVAGAGKAKGLLGQRLTAVDPTNLDNVALRANARAGKAVERELRGPLFIDTFLKTGDADRAMEAVVKYHFDYSDLSSFEQRYMKRLFPFYTWTRKNFPLQIQELASRPGRYTRYLHAKRNIELGLEKDEDVPSYYGDLLAIKTPFKSGQNPIYATPDLPFRDVTEIADPMMAIGQLNPLLKTPLEAASGKQFYTDVPFTNRLTPVPKTWAPIAETLRLGGGKFGLPKIVKGKGGELLISDKDAYKIEQALPLLGRMRRLLPSEERYQTRALTSWVSFVFGLGGRTLDPSSQFGEVNRQVQQLQALNRRQQELEQ